MKGPDVSSPPPPPAQRSAAELLPGALKLVEAATRRFAERGYHGTSVREIAADAEMTVAGLYHHFESKQDLLQWIMVDALQDVLGRTRAALAEADDDPVSQLRAVVVAWLLFHTHRQPEALIGSSELRSLDPNGFQKVVGLRDEQETVFRAVIDRGLASGVFDVPYPKEATRAIINMGYAVANWFRPSGPLTPDELGQRYALLALQMVGTPANTITPGAPTG